jgi:hypothetical protein
MNGDAVVVVVVVAAAVVVVNTDDDAAVAVVAAVVVVNTVDEWSRYWHFFTYKDIDKHVSMHNRTGNKVDYQLANIVDAYYRYCCRFDLFPILKSI